MKITFLIPRVLEPYEKREMEFRGSGTESDPAIIEPSENLPGYIMLELSNLYITIQNCYLDKILLVTCQNVKIENCNVRIISLPYCSNISLIKSTIRRTISFWESDNIKIAESTINRLKIRLSNSNIIKNSTIKKVKFITGHDNILEANTIPEKHLNKIKKRYWYHWYKLKII